MKKRSTKESRRRAGVMQDSDGYLKDLVGNSFAEIYNKHRVQGA